MFKIIANTVSKKEIAPPYEALPLQEQSCDTPHPPVQKQSYLTNSRLFILLSLACLIEPALTPISVVFLGLSTERTLQLNTTVDTNATKNTVNDMDIPKISNNIPKPAPDPGLPPMKYTTTPIKVRWKEIDTRQPNMPTKSVDGIYRGNYITLTNGIHIPHGTGMIDCSDKNCAFRYEGEFFNGFQHGKGTTFQTARLSIEGDQEKIYQDIEVSSDYLYGLKVGEGTMTHIADSGERKTHRVKFDEKGNPKPIKAKRNPIIG
ncbi:hypothetical protein DID77_00960 [Candidatus Marinamargulisbacteria bacterium SCGC AG-439-L15]|nr:hypothetical protein DID77_00960 [Candidatus Marinamargulisbacteria bacterium SCGC AG-439-L15]